MTQTILLDLDNTLLGNEMSRFLPPYFASLEQRLRPYIADKDLQSLMVASVQRMQANQDPTITNMAAFMNDFTARVQVSAQTIEPVIESFYREDYPRLKQYTTFRPEAEHVVDYLLTQGYQVVIATNPLFPATAIEQRLAWAGVSHFLYLLVTTMENSHFSKPNPRYYQEILAKTKSHPEQSWMVGDDLENDIVPARSLGLKTWWIREIDLDTRTEPEPLADEQGDLAKFLSWLQAGGLAGET